MRFSPARCRRIKPQGLTLKDDEHILPFAACWLVNVWHESELQETKIAKLRRMSEKAPATDLKGGKAVAEQSALPQSDTAVRDYDEPILHDISLLKEKNPDCVGWVSIPGTGIDFPVMQNSDFYLKHDFEGSYTDYGLPSLDQRCDPETSDQLIIYGHHMNDGSMFSALLNYANGEWSLSLGTGFWSL